MFFPPFCSPFCSDTWQALAPERPATPPRRFREDVQRGGAGEVRQGTEPSDRNWSNSWKLFFSKPNTCESCGIKKHVF